MSDAAVLPPVDDDHDEGAIDLAEDPPDKEPRWREVRGERLAAERRAERNALADELETAAIALRDAELALQRARASYGDALQAFNKFVAPVPG